ncbi:MAG: ABC transporter permease [Tabrizicola sp.]|nr:ABC transporter permease [Tabrizicola sp.]
MIGLVARRLLAAIPVLFIVALIAFGLLYLAPGDPAAVIAGDIASPEDVARIRESLGLNEPFFVRLGIFLNDLLHGNLGTSIFSNQPVTELIAQRMGPTLSLACLTIVLSVAIAVPLGALAAWYARSPMDWIALTAGIVGFSVPVFVIAYLLVWVFSVKLAWFPVQGYKPLSTGILTWLHHLTLPAISLASVYIALITRITRTSMLEVIGQDYIRTARSKGLGDGIIIWRHALTNASIPIVTVIGIGIALLMGGVVVTETVFSIPGIGRLLVDAILRRDYPIIQGVMILLSAIYVAVNICVDISYIFFDPKLRN